MPRRGGTRFRSRQCRTGGLESPSREHAAKRPLEVLSCQGDNCIQQHLDALFNLCGCEVFLGQ
jgi:hypothetical protein